MEFEMLTVVVSVTDEKVFWGNLEKSLKEQDTSFILIFSDPKLPLWTSYNQIKEIKTSFVVFFSQDVVLCEKGWLRKAENLVKNLPNLGMAGVSGWDEEGKWKGSLASFHTRLKEKKKVKRQQYGNREILGLIRGWPAKKPERVNTLDAMALIVPKKIWGETKFDDKNFDFHCGALDYSLTLREKGKDLYALPLLTFENSVTSFTKEYLEKHGTEKRGMKKLRQKWKGKFKYAGSKEL